MIWPACACATSLVPLLTSAGIIFGGLISNTFVVETIFNIPGLGRIAIDSIFARDYPVAMAIVMLFTLFFIADQPRGRRRLRPDRPAHPRRMLARMSDRRRRRCRRPRRAKRAGFWRRFLRQRNAVIGGVIVAIVLVVALLAPLLAPHPDRRDRSAQCLGAARRPRTGSAPTSSAATSLSRLIAGARTSLLVAGAVLAITLARRHRCSA